MAAAAGAEVLALARYPSVMVAGCCMIVDQMKAYVMGIAILQVVAQILGSAVQEGASATGVAADVAKLLAR